MKVFNIEDGNPILYVQCKDIKKVLELNNINDDYLDLLLNMGSKNNQNAFIRLDNEELINYFNSKDYILDYTLLQQFDVETLLSIKYQFEKQWNQELVNNTNNKVLGSIRLKELDYKYLSMIDVIETKLGFNSRLFPSVVDPTKEELPVKVSDKYIVRYGINNNTIVITRRDNEYLDYNDLDLDLTVEIAKEFVANYNYSFEYEVVEESNKVFLYFVAQRELEQNRKSITIKA